MRNFGIELEFVLPRNTSKETIAAKLREAGVETFVEGYNHRNRPHWKIVHDASVPGGCELVSPILSGEADIQLARKAANALDTAGCRVNRSTGFHVHVDGSDLTTDGYRKLASLYRSNESKIDAFMPPSRRNGGYCRRLLQNSLEGCDSIASVSNAISGRSRYFKLNLEAHFRHGTAEFRQHSGTLNADKVENWVRFCLAAVEFAKRSSSQIQPVNEPINLTGKTAICVELASRPEGCTTDDIRAATGWTKTGGFNHAIRRAGFVLRKVREGRTMRYFAERPTTTTVEPRSFATLDELLTELNLTRRSRDYFAARTANFA